MANAVPISFKQDEIDNILKSNQKCRTSGVMLKDRIGMIPLKRLILIGMILPIHALAGGRRVKIQT